MPSESERPAKSGKTSKVTADTKPKTSKVEAKPAKTSDKPKAADPPKPPAKSTGTSGSFPKPAGRSGRAPVVAIEARADADLVDAELTVRCGKCDGAISSADITARVAVKDKDGKWVCKNCYSKKAGQGAAGAATKGTVKLCPTCDSPLRGEGFSYGGRAYCTGCKPEFQRLLGEGAAPFLGGKSIPCASCKKPAQGEGAIVVGSAAYCKACRATGDKLILAAVRAHRKKMVGRSPLALILPLVGAALVVVAMGAAAVLTKPTKQAEGDPKVVKKDDPGGRLLDKMTEETGKVWIRFEDARDSWKRMKDLFEQGKAFPEYADRYKDQLQIATEKMEHFAPAEAGRRLAAAAEAVGKPKLTYKDFEKAVMLLSDFPEELRNTPSGENLELQRIKYEKLGKLYKAGEGFLVQAKAIDTTGKFDVDAAETVKGSIERLLNSTDSKKLEFDKTELGKQLAAELSRLSNAWDREKNAVKGTEQDIARRIKDCIAAGVTAEKKREWPAAEKEYLKVLVGDSSTENKPLGEESPEAACGMARLAIERDKYHEDKGFLQWARRATSLGGGSDEAALIEAWSAYLSGNKERTWEKVGALMKGQLGTRLGRRLKAMVDRALPKPPAPPKQGVAPANPLPNFVSPTVDKHHVRLTAPIDNNAKAFAALEDFELADRANEVLGITTDIYQIFLFTSEGDLSGFVASLDTKKNDDGSLPGCFATAIIGDDKKTIRRAAANMIVARSALPANDFRQWVLAVLPDLANDTKTPRISSLKLEKLEKLPASDVVKDQKALETAKGLGSMLWTDEGGRALATYARDHAKDPEGARKALLDFFVRRHGGKVTD